MDRIAALLTCHNRREKTLACLAALYAARDRNPGLGLRVYLTDDASTDGTAEAVRAFDPEIQVIHGPGDLYWNRGMVAAWRAALDWGERYDAFLLLNDDTLLDEDALGALLETERKVGPNAIIVGALRDPKSGELTYGGIRRTSRWHPGRTARMPIAAEPQNTDTFNGNCVLVPVGCFERIGMLDPIFTHTMGDFDYGLRAGEAGIRMVVAPGTFGTCPKNEVRGSWRDPNLSLRQRIRSLNSPKGLPYHEWREYLGRYGAPFPWLLAAAPLLSVVLTGWLGSSMRDQR
jgi:GT2 family glycosyltransferase